MNDGGNVRTQAPKPKLSDRISLRAAWITLAAAVLSAFVVAVPVVRLIWPPGPTAVSAQVQQVIVQQGFTWQQWVNMFPSSPGQNPPSQGYSPGVLVQVQAVVIGGQGNQIYSATLRLVNPLTGVVLPAVPPTSVCTEAVPVAPHYGFVLNCWASAPEAPDQRFCVLTTLVAAAYPTPVTLSGRVLHSHTAAVLRACGYETPGKQLTPS